MFYCISWADVSLVHVTRWAVSMVPAIQTRGLVCVSSWWLETSVIHASLEQVIWIPRTSLVAAKVCFSYYSASNSTTHADWSWQNVCLFFVCVNICDCLYSLCSTLPAACTIRLCPQLFNHPPLLESSWLPKLTQTQLHSPQRWTVSSNHPKFPPF